LCTRIAGAWASAETDGITKANATIPNALRRVRLPEQMLNGGRMIWFSHIGYIKH
jgi:hypothetical protein